MSIELIQAATNKQINKVYQCLLRGDSVNFKENLHGDTALHKALICGHKDVVILLLHWGADSTIANNQGFTSCDIYDGTYRFLDREFEKQQEESLDLMGNNFEDNYAFKKRSNEMSKNSHLNSKALTVGIITTITMLCAIAGFTMLGATIMTTAAYGFILGGVIGTVVGRTIDRYYGSEVVV